MLTDCHDGQEPPDHRIERAESRDALRGPARTGRLVPRSVPGAAGYHPWTIRVPVAAAHVESDPTR